MISRLFDVILATFMLVLVISAGWLQTPHNRLGGIVCVVFAAALYLKGFRRRRAR